MPDPDLDLAKQFAVKMLGIYTGAVLTKLIDIGYQTGLFESSKVGPASSEELSERAGLNERYVREWLGAMTTGGFYTYDPATQRYTLPEEHARALTGDGASNLCPASRIINHFGTHLPALTLDAIHDQVAPDAVLRGISQDTPRPRNCSYVCRHSANAVT